MPPDLLTALVAYLRSVPVGLPALAEVYAGEAPAGSTPPYVIVEGYLEHLPGESQEDSTADGLVITVTNSLDAAMALGAAVKAALDSPNISPASLRRDAFIWATGTESAVLRNDSRPRRLPGLGRGGKYVYVEEINYVFWVTPTQ